MEYRYKIPDPGVTLYEAEYAIAERLERMAEEQAKFHIDLLGALSDLGRRLEGIQKAATGG